MDRTAQTQYIFGWIGRVFLFAGLFFSGIEMTAQSSDVDSLWQVYESATQDSVRLDLLSQLSWKYLRINPGEAMRLANQVLQYGDSVGIEKEDAKALNSIGLAYFLEGEMDQSIEYFQQGNAKAHEIGDSASIATTTQNQGLIYSRLGQYAKAYAFYKQGSDLALELGNEQDYCSGLGNMGIMLKILRQYENAAYYFQKALEVGKRIGKTSTVNTALFHLGNIAEFRDSLGVAENYYLMARDGLKKDGDDFGLASIYIPLGRIERLKGNYELALQYLDSTILIVQDLPYGEVRGFVMIESAYVKLEQNAYQEALDLANSIEKPQSLDIRYQRDLAYVIATANKELKRFDKAYEAQVQYSLLNDSLYNEGKTKVISGLEVLHDVEQKEIENQLLKEQKAKNEVALRQRNIILFGTVVILILLIILALILYNNYKQKLANNVVLEKMVAKRTAELEESNKNLARFAFITSHDLKEPIRNITGFIQLIDRKISSEYGENSDLMEYMDFVVRNAKQMHTLIDDVQTFTTLEQKAKELSPVRLSSVVNRVQDAMRSRIQSTDTEIEIIKDIEFLSHASLLFIVLKNLVENAIKYNESDPPQIMIEGRKEKDGTMILVSDNGIGIEEKYQDQIFEMFTRLHDRSKYDGSGLGLSICKKIINQLEGDIWAKSEQNGGSTFHIWLPYQSEKGLMIVLAIVYIESGISNCYDS